jgi:hypothetical protein
VEEGGRKEAEQEQQAKAGFIYYLLLQGERRKGRKIRGVRFLAAFELGSFEHKNAATKDLHAASEV